MARHEHGFRWMSLVTLEVMTPASVLTDEMCARMETVPAGPASAAASTSTSGDTRRGEKYVTVIIDLTCIRDGTRPNPAAGRGRGPLRRSKATRLTAYDCQAQGRRAPDARVPCCPAPEGLPVSRCPGTRPVEAITARDPLTVQ